MNQELGLITGNQWEGKRALSQQEYESYVKSCSRLKIFSTEQDLFRMVNDCIVGYKKVALEIHNTYLNHHQVPLEIKNSLLLDINKALLSYLSSIHVFLEHTEVSLNNRDKKKLEYFKKLQSHFFDNFFAYRFIYKLRHYTEHVKMAVCGFEISKSLDEKTGKKSFILNIGLNRNKLLESDVFRGLGGKLKKEVESLPEYIIIEPYLKEMLDYISQLCGSLIIIDLPELKDSAQKIYNLITPIMSTNGIPCILWIDEIKNGKNLIKREDIPLGLVNRVMALEKEFHKNSS